MPLPRNAKEMQYTGYEQSSEAPLNASLKFLEEMLGFCHGVPRLNALRPWAGSDRWASATAFRSRWFC